MSAPPNQQRASISESSQTGSTNRNWIRERFDAGGPIKEDTAMSSLPRGASRAAIDNMITTLAKERNQVQSIIKMEVEKLMRFGADVTQMTCNDKSTGSVLSCVHPRNMRESYVQDGGTENIKRLHWIFHELPHGTHEDVLPQRQTHQDLVVARVVRAMNITWAAKKEGETASHRNCIQHSYSKIMNEKRQTVINSNRTNHGRKPLVKHPKTFAASNKAATCKKGQRMHHWTSKTEGENCVRKV